MFKINNNFEHVTAGWEATGLFLYALKTRSFSDIFGRYGKRPVTWNGLRQQNALK